MAHSAVYKILQMEHSDFSEIKLSYQHYSVKPECTIRVVYIRVIRVPF